MVVNLLTVAFRGVSALKVEMQLALARGKMGFVIVGLPDKAIAESRERVQAALKAVGVELPAKKILINLAPADLPKEGSHYDLPIALGVLEALNIIPANSLANTLSLGELSLNGKLNFVSGGLLAAKLALETDCNFICPAACAQEAGLLGASLKLLAPSTLLELVAYFRDSVPLPTPELPDLEFKQSRLDLKDVKGQNVAKRALEVAAAGGHNLLFTGAPGAGKSMLAERLPSILPPLTSDELLENLLIRSSSGFLGQDATIHMGRPFRSPHHSASQAALIGGGQKIGPGEVSLANNGVLFLDELPEFAPSVLDSLRQLLETGVVNIARANQQVTYPAKIQLIAAMNPCKCGFAQHVELACKKYPACVNDYTKRISGPLLDRIDIKVNVAPLKAFELVNLADGEPSELILKRVLLARARQAERYKKFGLSNIINATCPAMYIEQAINYSAGAKKLLELSLKRLNLSARGFFRVLKVAQTIADLEEAPLIEERHLSEALIYRGDAFPKG